MTMNFNGGYGMPPYYPQQQPPMQQQAQTTQAYRIIPVSSKNDTNAAIADFNGTPIYFHNQSNNEIYIKQFDLKTGVTTLQEYKRVEPPVSDKKDVVKVNTYENDFKAINDRLDGLYKLLETNNVEEVEEVKKGNKK